MHNYFFTIWISKILIIDLLNILQFKAIELYGWEFIIWMIIDDEKIESIRMNEFFENKNYYIIDYKR